MEIIINSLIAICVAGLVFGLVLGYAGIKFKVTEDPILPLIKAALPGVNCAGCGYTGCASFAEAVLRGEAAPNSCPVGGETTVAALSKALGIEITARKRTVAAVKCGGDCQKAKSLYIYEGMQSCEAAKMLAGGGSKGCAYGCLGGGSCKAVCDFGAIEIVGGISVVKKEKCTACGKCIIVCPKEIIEMIPYAVKTKVLCNSKEKGKDVREVCGVGCIACKLCEKACEAGAILVKSQLAEIDYDRCTDCGSCEKKCPTKCIAS
ncbi:MAG: RnfABCDGE type electron transport complex subunit B [Defluviitaleaceae bacterium]|nr:RnfABCDGE type electron transport complex subunit B [Defluviitaleaceae bacterium]